MNYDDLIWKMRGLAEAYPEDVFTPLTDDDIQKHPMLITRTSAQMGRHLGKFFIEAADAIQELQRDAMRLDWLQEQYTLHKEAEIWYVVDGYQINLTEQDGSVCRLSASGETLRQAIDEAMQREPDTAKP